MSPNFPVGRAAALLTLIVALLAETAGCSGSPKAYTVKGRVVFKDDQKPLNKGQVSFESVAEPKALATSLIDEQGNFELGSQFGRGTPEGEYRVRVEPALPDGPSLGRKPPSPKEAMATIVDKRYLDFSTSDLRVSIQPGNNDLTIEVDRPRRR
jgi:hypothetical protein